VVRDLALTLEHDDLHGRLVVREVLKISVTEVARWCSSE